MAQVPKGTRKIHVGILKEENGSIHRAMMFIMALFCFSMGQKTEVVIIDHLQAENALVQKCLADKYLPENCKSIGKFAPAHGYLRARMMARDTSAELVAWKGGKIVQRSKKWREIKKQNANLYFLFLDLEQDVDSATIVKSKK